MKIEWKAWWRLPAQFRFLAAGGYNTIFGYIVFSTLYVTVGRRINYLVIGLLAYLISLVSAFAVYRYLVFRSTEPLGLTFVRFNLSQLAALGCGMAGLYVLVKHLRFTPPLAQALVTLTAALITYLLHRHFSFRNHSTDG